MPVLTLAELLAMSRAALAAMETSSHRARTLDAEALGRRTPTSKLTLPVLRLLLLEKTDSIPRTKAEIVIALAWFQVHDVDAGHLQRLQRKARSAS